MKKLVSRQSLKLGEKVVGYRYNIINSGKTEVSLNVHKSMYKDFELLLGKENMFLVGSHIRGYSIKDLFSSNSKVNMVEVKTLEEVKVLLIKYGLFEESI